MELKATTLGKRMAQHPYDRVEILNAGVRVSGPQHEYLIPFNQLININCKRGLVWGELEFVLPEDKVVRLHGTEWSDTQRFHRHLMGLWQEWSAEMSAIAAGLLQSQLAIIAGSSVETQWLTRQKAQAIRQQIITALEGLPLPTSRLAEFDNCRDAGYSARHGLLIKKAVERSITSVIPRPCSHSTTTFLTRLNPLR